ncbi:hypothetical protein EGW08_005865, partial [Elysia chlorotica]
AICEAETNVHLAEPRTEDQWNIVQELTRSRYGGNGTTAWLGATDLALEDDWRWLSNNDVVEVTDGPWWHFVAGPDNSWGNQHCMFIDHILKLDDEYCDVNHSFVCQK